MAITEMPLPAPKIWTFEEYMAPPDIEGSYEIIDGEFLPMPGATNRHQFIVVRLVHYFFVFEEANKTGRTLTAPRDVVIRRAPLRTRQPDVLFISNERSEEAGGEDSDGPLEVGPELIVEVISPSETRRTILKKLADYQSVGVQSVGVQSVGVQSVGVKEAWLISPNSETVEVLQLTDTTIQTIGLYVNGQTCVSVAVPGLSVVLADIFG